MHVDVEKTREEFYAHKKRFFENGALREICAGEIATAYSLADVGYGLVVFAIKPGEGNSYDVLFCTLDEIRQYMENQDILYDMMKHKVEVTKEAYIFNDRFDARLEELNQRRIETGETSIDLEAEKKLLADIAKKQEQLSKPCFLLRLGRVLLLLGIGGYAIGAAPLYSISPEVFEIYGTAMLLCTMAGIILGGIGAYIGNVRKKASS